jgi:hypothetical protein
MANHTFKDPKAKAALGFTLICLAAVIALFAVGGAFFSREHPKVLNYVSDTCQVDSTGYKTYKCETRYSSYICYGALWEIHHGENKTIFARVEGERRYSDYRDAIKEAHEYQVSRLSK